MLDRKTQTGGECPGTFPVPAGQYIPQDNGTQFALYNVGGFSKPRLMKRT